MKWKATMFKVFLENHQANVLDRHETGQFHNNKIFQGTLARAHHLDP